MSIAVASPEMAELADLLDTNDRPVPGHAADELSRRAMLALPDGVHRR